MTQITNAPSSETPFVDPKTGRIARSWFQWLLGIISTATTGGDVTHTGTLADHHVVLGNGAADIRALAGSGTAGQLLTSNGAAADPTFQAPATAGTVTHTGTLTSGKLIQGNGGADVTANATTATVTKLTAGTPSAASAGTDYVAPGAITSDGITMSTARLLGRTTAATGAVEEITAGTGLTLSAGTLTATGSGGTVTTTGSPASGNLTKFSGATSITNADLTGDVTTSGTVATTLATVNANVGTFGDGTHVAQVTANAKGLITAVSSVAITNTGTVTHTAGNLTLNQVVYGAGSADLKVVAATDGQIPIGKTSDGTAALATLTAGTGITITNGANSIAIATSAVGSLSTIVKSADETVTSSTALQNDDELVFAIVANGVYKVEGCLLTQGSTAGDIKVTFTVPASATGQMAFYGSVVGATTNDQMFHVGVVNDFATPDFFNLGTIGTAADKILPVVIAGAIFNSTNAGNLQLQWAQNTSSGTATTVLKGSWITVTRTS